MGDAGVPALPTIHSPWFRLTPADTHLYTDSPWGPQMTACVAVPVRALLSSAVDLSELLSKVVILGHCRFMYDCGQAATDRWLAAQPQRHG